MDISHGTFLNPSAINLWSKSILPDDRVLITGASGWFGRTASYLMSTLPAQTKFVASQNREINLHGFNYFVEKWDLSSAISFNPTVVIDTAFVTREQVNRIGLESYVQINRRLTSQLLSLASLDSVRKILTISSGAALNPDNSSLIENPYGVLKKEAEEQLIEAREKIGQTATIARAWSVSGAFVRNPMNYAFSNMIIQAMNGKIEIFSPVTVYRRYCAVEELLAVSLAQDASKHSIIDSGGVLVEIGQLADEIVKLLNPSAEIIRKEFSNQESNYYMSDSRDWNFQSSLLGLSNLSLEEQILKSKNGLNFFH